MQAFCPLTSNRLLVRSWSIPVRKSRLRGDGFGPTVATPEIVLVAQSLLLDQVAGDAVAHLDEAGVPSILLKGAVIATWLYGDGHVRPYSDVDLLVAPSQFERAKEVLAELGYVHRLTGAHPGEFGPKEQELFGPRGTCIDLHHGLIGLDAPAERNWEILARRTTPFRLLPAVDVKVLDVPARAMHLALHAAQNGPVDIKAIADLERGLDKVERDGWRDAAELAAQLGGSEAFAAGLRLVPAGQALADELSLTRRMTVELALRTRSAPQDAIFFERLAGTPGLCRRAGLLFRKVFPTATFVRANSPRVSGLGLVRARAVHVASLAGRLAPAILAWRRARQTARGDA